MKTEIQWSADTDGVVNGIGCHDGYFYGAVQRKSRLVLYVQNAEQDYREVELLDIHEMNISDFWIGSIIGDIWWWPLNEVSVEMWEKLFAGRIAKHDRDGSLRRLIATVKGTHFFALEGSYGANVYAACNQLRVFDTNA